MSATTRSRILLVDDDDLVLDMYRRMLSRHFDVRTALGAQKAIEVLEAEGPFAVIMSDFKMPLVNGVDLLRQVRTRWPRMSRILVTGQLDVPEMSGETDLATVIGKPCPHPEMLAVLMREVNAYEARGSAGE